MKKKLFSVILTLCMALSLFLGNSVSADAADKTIYSVVIESIPTMEIGGSIADAKATFLDVPEGCIAESHWHIWNASANDGDGEWQEIYEGTFSETDVYYLCMTFQAEEGYTFSDDFEVSYVDGLEEGKVWSTYDENDNLIWHCDMEIESFATAIYDIVVTTPEVVPGNTAALEDIKFYSGDEIIANENFDIEATWICETHNYEDVTGKPFEDGCYYTFDLNIKPHAGYYFFDELNVIHNGVANEHSYDTPTHCNYLYSKSLLAPLESIELAGLPEVKVGETMVDSLDVITNLDDINCDVYVTWWDENGDDTTGQKMKDGHVYTFQIEVSTFGQVPLSEDFVFVIDGTEYAPTELDELNEHPSQAWLEFEYDFSGGASAGDYDDDFEDNADVEDDTETEDDVDVVIKDDNTTSPKTGDSSMIMVWMILALASMGTIVFVRKRQ